VHCLKRGGKERKNARGSRGTRNARSEGTTVLLVTITKNKKIGRKIQGLRRIRKAGRRGKGFRVEPEITFRGVQRGGDGKSEREGH